MKDTTMEQFLLENEEKTNSVMQRIFWFCTLAFPMFFIGKFLQIFPHMSYFNLSVYTCIMLLMATAFTIATKKSNEKPFVKYMGMIFGEIIVIILTINRGFSPFIAYVIIPLASCLYFNVRFSYIISAVCYAAMMVSLVLRGLDFDFSCYTSDIVFSSGEWIRAYCLGCSIEFLCSFFIIRRLTKIAQNFMFSVYERNRKLMSIQSGLISAFANLVESKDHTTGKHVKRVSSYVSIIARRLRQNGFYAEELSDHVIILLETAAPLHDVGKIAIPDAILSKTGKLTWQEYSIIQNHPFEGARIIKENTQSLEDTEFVQIAHDMALFHHEHWDGTGYPFRLVEDEIPLAARIMTAADILDALLSSRSYKRAYPLEESLDVVRDLSGTCLEPCIVDAILDSSEEIKDVLQRFPEDKEIPFVQY